MTYKKKYFMRTSKNGMRHLLVNAVFSDALRPVECVRDSGKEHRKLPDVRLCGSDCVFFKDNPKEKEVLRYCNGVDQITAYTELESK